MIFERVFVSLALGVALLGAWTPLWAQTARFAYVANSSSNNVSAYSIDATTGALVVRKNSRSPFDGLRTNG